MAKKYYGSFYKNNYHFVEKIEKDNEALKLTTLDCCYILLVVVLVFLSFYKLLGGF
jgi:hypothetical protein